jgi:HK97 family phage prohead protease
MTVSDRPWSDFTQADYTPEQWARACLIDTGDGAADSKSRYKLPVREPSGTLNRNGVHAAAGGHGLAAVQGISAEQRRIAARKLIVIYRDLKEDPPESLLSMAGTRSVQESSMPEYQYRSFTPDLQVRSGGDGRTIMGIAVPYNAPTRIDDNTVEEFVRGAFNHQLNKPQLVKFAREHYLLGGELIGAASLLRDDAIGLYAELRTSKTPKGDETLELVRDGALSQLSIMFSDRQIRRLGGGHVQRVKAHLGEVAIVAQGAYGDLASVAGVRSGGGLATVERTDEDLRRQAEQYLIGGGLPDPPDHELEIRAIKLGLPYS